MRAVWLLAIGLGCGGAPGPHSPSSPAPVVPRLGAPPVLDLTAPDAAYREQVAAAFRSGWTQFLEDCRLRLPPAHPLNTMTLAATAVLTVDAKGAITDARIEPSGNADFDRAVAALVHDATPLPPPPVALLGDDDRVHLRWLFARDRRQAGPATATLEARRLPIAEAARRFIAADDLDRLAQRIEVEPAGTAREAATEALMNAALAEALGSSDVTVRLAALDAIREGNVGALAGELDELVAPTRSFDIRIAAMRAAAAVGEHGVVYPLTQVLRRDLTVDRELARTEIDTLVALDSETWTADTLRTALASKPNPIALYAAGGVAVPSLARRIVAWTTARDVHVRAAACAALESVADGVAWPALQRGIHDRDATVRASCLETVTRRIDIALVGEESQRSRLRGEGRLPKGTALAKTLNDATRDRDAVVRAAAVTALGHLASALQLTNEPMTAIPDLSSDKVSSVRAAYAGAIAIAPADDGRDHIRMLLDDADGDVRAAAWSAFIALPRPADFDELLVRALTDPAAPVRRAAVDAVRDDAVLMRLASHDDDGDVRTAALVRYASLSGRAAASGLLLGKIASSAPASADRVRAALAWHLAH